MAVSNDKNPGLWKTLNGGKPVLTSGLGTKGIRDPSPIIPADQSKYYLIATVFTWPEYVVFAKPATDNKCRISR
jgi:sucrose-6-phosphate hydrolase SacC (GH32 family)